MRDWVPDPDGVAVCAGSRNAYTMHKLRRNLLSLPAETGLTGELLAETTLFTKLHPGATVDVSDDEAQTTLSWRGVHTDFCVGVPVAVRGGRLFEIPRP